MKLKHVFTFFILSLFLIKIEAQTADKKIPFNFSADFEIPSESHLEYINVGGEKTLVTFYNIKKFEYSFAIYDAELKLIASKTINIKDLCGKNINFDDSYFKNIEQTIYFFYYTKESKTQSLHAIEFSPSTLEFIGNNSTIKANIQGDLSYIEQSPDNSKVLFHFFSAPNGKKGAQRRTINLLIIDKNLKKILDQEYDIPYDPTLPYSFLVNNDGNVFSYGKVFDNNKGQDLNSDIPNYHYEAYTFEIGKKVFITNIVNLKEFFINPYNYPKIVLNTDNTFSLFFDCCKKEKGLTGIAYMKIDSKKHSYDLKDYYYEVPNEIIEKENNSTSNVVFDDFKAYALDDGACNIVFVEKRAVGVNCYLFSGFYTMCLDKNNQLKWVKKIPTKQINCSSYGGIISWSGFVSENVLNILYFDLANNLNLANGTKLNKYEHVGDSKDDGNLICAKIDTKSNITKDIVLRIKDCEFYISANAYKLFGQKLIHKAEKEKILSSKVAKNQTMLLYSFDIK